jgi:hypothetical protein
MGCATERVGASVRWSHTVIAMIQRGRTAAKPRNPAYGSRATAPPAIER